MVRRGNPSGTQMEIVHHIYLVKLEVSNVVELVECVR
jgi:hypothetical protein